MDMFVLRGCLLLMVLCGPTLAQDIELTNSTINNQTDSTSNSSTQQTSSTESHAKLMSTTVLLSTTVLSSSSASPINNISNTAQSDNQSLETVSTTESTSRTSDSIPTESNSLVSIAQKESSSGQNGNSSSKNVTEKTTPLENITTDGNQSSTPAINTSSDGNKKNDSTTPRTEATLEKNNDSTTPRSNSSLSDNKDSTAKANTSLDDGSMPLKPEPKMSPLFAELSSTPRENSNSTKNNEESTTTSTENVSSGTEGTTEDPMDKFFDQLVGTLNKTLWNVTTNITNSTNDDDLHEIGDFLNKIFDFGNAIYNFLPKLGDNTNSNATKDATTNSTKTLTLIYFHQLENATVINLIKAVEVADVINRLRPKNIFLALLPVLIEGRLKIRPFRRIIYNSIQELVEWTPLKVYNKRVNKLISYIAEYPQRAREKIEKFANMLKRTSELPDKVVKFFFRMISPIETLAHIAEKVNDIRFKYMPLRKMAADLRIERRLFANRMKPRNLVKNFIKSKIEEKTSQLEEAVGGIVICLKNQTCAIVI